MTVFLFVSLLVMLAASVPIFIALCGSVTASFLLFSNMDTTIIIQRMFAGINKFSLMSIPLFVLAANLMSGKYVLRCHFRFFPSNRCCYRRSVIPGYDRERL